MRSPYVAAISFDRTLTGTSRRDVLGIVRVQPGLLVSDARE
jgi:hypothetical protein